MTSGKIIDLNVPSFQYGHGPEDIGYTLVICDPGIDTDFFSPGEITNNLGIKEELIRNNTIISSSRITYNKGITYILRAMSILKRRNFKINADNIISIHHGIEDLSDSYLSSQHEDLEWNVPESFIYRMISHNIGMPDVLVYATICLVS